MDQKTILYYNVKNNYQHYFKILTVIDLYNVTTRLINLADKGISYKKSIDLIKQLNKSSDYYLTTILNDLNKSILKNVDHLEFPILTIIKDIFEENHVNAFDEKSYNCIIDVYNYTNGQDFSISNVGKYPPNIVKYGEIIDGKIKHNTQEEIKLNKNIIQRTIYENESHDNFSVIDLIMKRQSEKNI